jgi:uncharacterized protein (DUF2237 family)
MRPHLNVLGTPLEICGHDPVTGFTRSGFCETRKDDASMHTVCAIMTQDFLVFTTLQGNDLISSRPDLVFPGLKPGDCWCLCALRWKEALEAGLAPPVVLEATHEDTLQIIPLETLKAHALKSSKFAQ